MTLSVRLHHRIGQLDLDLEFDAPQGVTALFGRSGSGKSTIANAVAGLMRPQGGHIASNDQTLFDSATDIDLPVHKRRIGYVFQDARLFPHMTVRRNMTFGQRFAPPGEPGPSLEDVSRLLGLEHLLDRRPGGLSGGERQRVAIGRALLSRPRTLLMDEPLAALDAARKEEILPYLERLRDQAGLPILYISHSVAEVARLANTVVVLDAGKIVRSGPTEEVLSDPSIVRQVGLREAGAVLPAEVAAHHADGLSELAVSSGRLFLPRLDTKVGAPTRVRILARDVILSLDRPEGLSALNILEGTVEAIHPGQGPGVIVQLKCGSDMILSRITRRSADALDLKPAKRAYAVIKTVSVARADIGSG
ncbi:MAG: molybdenum ABC transporter ATP-binding protein [Rhodobacteraceae bacterium]|nr:molybdenum ABC transporter ATP-binding protein [Paracoccaceae bacterium]